MLKLQINSILSFLLNFCIAAISTQPAFQQPTATFFRYLFFQLYHECGELYQMRCLSIILIIITDTELMMELLQIFSYFFRHYRGHEVSRTNYDKWLQISFSEDTPLNLKTWMLSWISDFEMMKTKNTSFHLLLNHWDNLAHVFCGPETVLLKLKYGTQKYAGEKTD